MRVNLPPAALATAKGVNPALLALVPKADGQKPKRRAAKPRVDPAIVLAAWCRERGWPAPVPEFRFAEPVRDWAFDFAWPTVKVALELEGGAFVQGRHTRGAGFVGDMEKYNESALRGWLLLRVETKLATSEATLGLLVRAMHQRIKGC